MTTVSHALAFARHGLAVFPAWWPQERNKRLVCSCRKGADCSAAAKHPYGPLAPNGLLSASAVADKIRDWFGQVPHANLGLVTDRLIVLDIDPRHDGDISLRTLENEYAPLPGTWRALTGGGGEHVELRRILDRVARREDERRDAAQGGEHAKA
jgi:Bifunctional DNA primase/polymerase, N-terminal